MYLKEEFWFARAKAPAFACDTPLLQNCGRQPSCQAKSSVQSRLPVGHGCAVLSTYFICRTTAAVAQQASQAGLHRKVHFEDTCAAPCLVDAAWAVLHSMVMTLTSCFCGLVFCVSACLMIDMLQPDNKKLQKALAAAQPSLGQVLSG